jgi:hypothetical protein
VKVAVRSERTHNPCGEAHWVSGLRENLTSRSDGEGLETGPWGSLRHRREAKAAGKQLIPVPYRYRASPLPDKYYFKPSPQEDLTLKQRMSRMKNG